MLFSSAAVSWAVLRLVVGTATALAAFLALGVAFLVLRVVFFALRVAFSVLRAACLAFFLAIVV